MQWLGYSLGNQWIVWFLVGAQYFLFSKTSTLSGAHPRSYFMGRRDSFPGSKIARMKITTQFHLVPGVRLSVANTPYMFMVCTGTTLPLPSPLPYQLSHINSNLKYIFIALTLWILRWGISPLLTQEYTTPYADINHALLVIWTLVFVVVQSLLSSVCYNYIHFYDIICNCFCLLR